MGVCVYVSLVVTGVKAAADTPWSLHSLFATLEMSGIECSSDMIPKPNRIKMGKRMCIDAWYDLLRSLPGSNLPQMCGLY